MKRLLFCCTILALGITRATAADSPAAQQALENAHRPSDLFQSTSAAFELELELSVHSGAAQQWKAKDHWWSKAVFGEFQQITVRNGEIEYTERNLDFTPMAVREMFKLLQLTQDGPPLIARKLKNRVDHGVAVSCLEVQLGDLKIKPHTICIDSGSHEMLSEEWDFADKRRQQFADYVEFEGSRFPKKLSLSIDGSSVLSANVIKLEAAPFQAALLDPPQGAIERRRCPNMRLPAVITHPDLNLVTNGPLQGKTTVSITVLTDGSVGDAQVIESGGSRLDKTTLAALKGMKFRPAMCGNDPVVYDLETVVNAQSY